MADKSVGNLAKYILKNNKNKDKNLKYDFMPSLLEIIERPSHVAGKVIVVAIASLLVVAVAWAALARIDIVVSGSGLVVTESDMGAVAAKNSGVVKKLHVSEGDYVKEGDTLLELDSSEIDLEIHRLENELDFLKVQREIVLKYVSDVNAQIHVEDYHEKYKYIINDIIYANRMYKMQAEQSYLDAELLKIQYLANLSEELTVIEERIREYEDELEKQQIILTGMVIKAQTSGYILSSSVSYEGQVVTGYEELFTIVPDSSIYVFEGYVADKDISDVSVGDEVQIKLQAYSFSDYGAVVGIVSYISPSTLSLEGLGNVYTVKVEIDEKLLHEDIKLKSGLSGTMEINVGKRTVLDYFLEPIIGELDESLKED